MSAFFYADILLIPLFMYICTPKIKNHVTQIFNGR
jgi:hypothetical protein